MEQYVEVFFFYYYALVLRRDKHVRIDTSLLLVIFVYCLLEKSQYLTSCTINRILFEWHREIWMCGNNSARHIKSTHNSISIISNIIFSFIPPFLSADMPSLISIHASQKGGGGFQSEEEYLYGLFTRISYICRIFSDIWIYAYLLLIFVVY